HRALPPTLRAMRPIRQEAAHLGTTTKADSRANRNAGFIRQAGEWHWGCRMNPAFHWWCQGAPGSAVSSNCHLE
ncbi:MAG: hypothetical protein NT167_07990, partial [Verrucomicrobia bacterium]|nr:hypothetical protein [Verrucomicrobiota bacterium]